MTNEGALRAQKLDGETDGRMGSAVMNRTAQAPSKRATGSTMSGVCLNIVA